MFLGFCIPYFVPTLCLFGSIQDRGSGYIAELSKQIVRTDAGYFIQEREVDVCQAESFHHHHTERQVNPENKMMLSANPFFPPQTFYTPLRPSPLAERPANVLSRPFTFTMPAQPDKTSASVPKRTHKPNPVIQSRDVASQRRRDMFFKRVQKDREDRRWEARGDQIQRLDFISDQKKWEAAKARQAPEVPEEYLDQEFEEFVASQSDEQYMERDVSEAEWIAAQEEHELQQMIASMEEADGDDNDRMSQHYGSDDEDYDQIFMECANLTDCTQQEQPSSSNFDDPDAMDMS
ncbi:hypothetical protein BU24DRAFT_452525 [Aaosphaeria arxii CBS 175.79]|uniref:Uncharacterized protein n=1 Tax=Aaosphaeria arxii CBS 175.79 TaxID=1450172 RepID=A0A6A5XMW6_9PLEO|nr:uncharacterized protein BU24DRAFT_452525 [Aaosphaeria arxii CBS 175.79]KAF2013684.1 hypothetical protein BU24DRAFT_452525 [Aaosphaeria arxii CBS 175.79]